MAKTKQLYLIMAGLGGGFGGATPKELGLFEDAYDALEYAASLSREEIDSYGGLHGLPNPDELDEDEYAEECESWLDYDATDITPNNYKEIIEELEQEGWSDDEISRIYNYINGLTGA